MLEALEKQPVAYQCNGCTVWSKFRLIYNDEMPKGWRELPQGYFCFNCRKTKENKKW